MIDIDILEEFERAYLECALWSSTDQSNEQGGDPLDQNYDASDFDPVALAELLKDCESFREQASALLAESGLSDEQAGHDFWLTRNGHGAGFWDRGLGEVGEKLTQLCKPYGSVYLYVHEGKVFAE